MAISESDPTKSDGQIIAIAGAGIGGLTLALALAQKGLRPILVERTPTFSEVGAGIQLSPNASRILIDLGLAGALADKIVEPDLLSVRQGRSGNLLSSAALRPGLRQRYGAPFWVVHRADLQSVLVEAVKAAPEITLLTGRRVTDFAVHGKGVTVMTTPSNGRQERYDDIRARGLVAADGIQSAIRQKLVPGTRMRPSGQIALRTVVETHALGSSPVIRDIGLWLGAKRHLVHYPIRGGRALNIVAIAPRRRDDNPDDGPISRRDGALRFADWCPAVQDLLAAVSEFTLWPLGDIDPLQEWSKGPVALLGDAAHATLPFLAQGGAMAIEDAACLAGHLASSVDVEAAFAAYAQARIARAHRIQRHSRRNGRIYHMGGYTAAVRDAGLILMGGNSLVKRYDWIYRHRAVQG